MSLTVELHRFKVYECKRPTQAKLEFRGRVRTSRNLLANEGVIYVYENYKWNVARPIDRGEVLMLTFITKPRFRNEQVLGIYTLGLDAVVNQGYLEFTDSLVDERNQNVSVYVEMKVMYEAPLLRMGDSSVTEDIIGYESETGSVQSTKSTQEREVVYDSTSPDNDTAPLLSLQRTIEHMETEMKGRQLTTTVDVESGAEPPRSRLQIAGKYLRRGLSLGAVSRAATINGRERNRSKAPLQAMRNLIRLGKQRTRSANDEETPFNMDDTYNNGASAPSQRQRSLPSDDVIIDMPSPPDTPMKKNNKLRSIRDAGDASALKAADFQVCVTVIEARQLAGLNMDPVVCVQVGELRKYTSVKESTNCPYYNEYFVFDFHMPPIMLFDKIITLSVLHSRNILRANKLLGSFKLDVATVWSQPDRQFYHKWALLTDPDDVASGAKGYVKCDISVIGKGDAIKIPMKDDKDEDNFEANLLLPVGVPTERQRARYIIKIYKADGLPKMNYSILANVKRAFTGEIQDLANPYVQVCFAGMSGRTSVRNNCYSPVWNEQIVFTEMFPPLCQRIMIQLRDSAPVQPNIIGTHFIDLQTISNPGEKGFIPTFGPTYINMYGSTRDYSLLDRYSNLNTGMGEGISYRARILVSIRTEILDSLDAPTLNVKVEPTQPINELTYGKNKDFFLFASIFDCNMINKTLTDKPLQFELSIGNAGNVLDGHYESVKRPQDLESDNLESVSADTGYWQSTTTPTKAESSNGTYYHLPYGEQKPCMHIRSVWPDHRYRMYNSNIIDKIVETLDEALYDVQAALDSDTPTARNSITLLKSSLDATSSACASYVVRAADTPPLGTTKLDIQREKMCLQEIEQIGIQSRKLKALVTQNSLKERLHTAYSYLNRLKQICEDPQHALPDVFIWLISDGKRLAYLRIPARDLIYSEHYMESGKLCGKMQTLFMKWPEKKIFHQTGCCVPAKTYVFLWLGDFENQKHYIDSLPKGYSLNGELKNTAPPTSLTYLEKHEFQLRAYIYQARSLIGSDASGLSDPYATIIIGEHVATTQVIDETLSPTWDELIIIDRISIHSTLEQIKLDPPTIVVEIFDQDQVGKSEFLGRTLAKPYVKSFAEPSKQAYTTPSLEWHEIMRGKDGAGELLAVFELLETAEGDNSALPELPLPKDIPDEGTLSLGTILPVPIDIRPTLSKYRFEVLFWGLRDLKRIHLLTVDKPRVDIECAGHIIYSSIIQNTKRNPNFTNPLKFIEVQLPDQDLYRPPLTIRVIDCRSFGRITLVGTHTINSIHNYIYSPISKKHKQIEDKKKTIIDFDKIDFKSNRFTREDITGRDESSPLLKQTDDKGSFFYGTGKFMTQNKNLKQSNKKRKQSADSTLDDDDDEGRRDWWTKYFASIDQMIEEERETKIAKQDFFSHIQNLEEPHCSHDERYSPRFDYEISNRHTPLSPKNKNSTTISKKNEIPKSSLAKIYPHELEAVPEFEEFKDWLKTFELYRGKKTEEETEKENRVVGIFKGALKVYKWPLPRGIENQTAMGFDPNYGFFQGVPSNDPIHVLVRVYIVKATDLHPTDLNGKADPYIVLHLGSKIISDKDNYVSKQLNPVFGKCFEIEATFPQDSMLTIQVLDWDLVGSDDLIGETKIDLENRFYSRHRASCGLPMKYEEQGYNRWRDAMKPTQILAKLCKDGKLDAPVYEEGRVKIGTNILDMPENPELFSNPKTIEEQMALCVLRQWENIPRVGIHLVPEHVETRFLYNPSKSGVEQGRLEMWVEMFPMDMPLPGAPMDISPRKPKSYEMRVIIWNTDDVVLEDDAFFTGEKMSDIYVKGWLKGPIDCQSTDIHYRSLTGEGNFNWRFIYPFDYMEAEEKIIISRKESVFSWDETECKIPARLELQVWDADHFSADDFLGALTLPLNRFPRGAKSSKLCTLDMLNNEDVPMVNLFKQKRVRGWWPFYIKRESEEMELTGKVEAEIHLLTKEEAEKVPAGLGRNEPDPLEKPSRPDASFMWFLNPLKSIRYIVWHNYKWKIIKGCAVLFLAVLIFLFFFAFPGYSAKKILGA